MLLCILSTCLAVASSDLLKSSDAAFVGLIALLILSNGLTPVNSSKVIPIAIPSKITPIGPSTPLTKLAAAAILPIPLATFPPTLDKPPILPSARYDTLPRLSTSFATFPILLVSVAKSPLTFLLPIFDLFLFNEYLSLRLAAISALSSATSAALATAFAILFLSATCLVSLSGFLPIPNCLFLSFISAVQFFHVSPLKSDVKLSHLAAVTSLAALANPLRALWNAPMATIAPVNIAVPLNILLLAKLSSTLTTDVPVSTILFKPSRPPTTSFNICVHEFFNVAKWNCTDCCCFSNSWKAEPWSLSTRLTCPCDSRIAF